jgi:hypothetical protein
MGVYSVTLELLIVIVVYQNILLLPSPGPFNTIAGLSTIVVQFLSVSNARPLT